MDKQKFIDEIKDYSTEDLQLILNTQKDLYSSEELSIIESQLKEHEKQDKIKQQEFIEQHLPKEITCPKCDGVNDFSNDNCCYCGFKFDKKKYYSIEYYTDESEEDETDNDSEEEKNSYLFQYIISFIVPLVGFILGAIMMSKDDEEEKSVGKALVVLGIISIVISSIIWIVVF